MTNKELLNYVAGYLDGEGCFRIDKSCCRIEATGCYPESIFLLKESFGGSIYKRKAKGKARSSWAWVLNGSPAALLAKKLAPFLKEKYEQALLLWEFYHEQSPIRREKIKQQIKFIKRMDFYTINIPKEGKKNDKRKSK